jgi:hypothetical protein
MVYGKPALIKNIKMNQKGPKRLMIGNILELQEVARSEVVVGEVGTTVFEFLVAAAFAIHVVMQ